MHIKFERHEEKKNTWETNDRRRKSTKCQALNIFYYNDRAYNEKKFVTIKPKNGCIECANMGSAHILQKHNDPNKRKSKRHNRRRRWYNQRNYNEYTKMRSQTIYIEAVIGCKREWEKSIEWHKRNGVQYSRREQTLRKCTKRNVV